MKKLITSFFNNEALSYLFFGVLTMLVSMFSRLIFFNLSHNATLSTALSDIIAILFAFITNDRIVFKQTTSGWFNRFLKFIISRLFTFGLNLLLSYLFVDRFPHIIGQFVNHDLEKVNLIETLFAQVLIIALNYIFSKLFVFKDKSKTSRL